MLDSITILSLAHSVYRFNNGFKYYKSWDYHKGITLWETNMELLERAIETYNNDNPKFTISKEDKEWADKVYKWFKRYSLLGLRDGSSFARAMYLVLFENDTIDPERYGVVSYIPKWWDEKAAGIVVLPSYARNILDNK